MPSRSRRSRTRLTVPLLQDLRDLLRPAQRERRNQDPSTPAEGLPDGRDERPHLLLAGGEERVTVRALADDRVDGRDGRREPRGVHDGRGDVADVPGVEDAAGATLDQDARRAEQVPAGQQRERETVIADPREVRNGPQAFQGALHLTGGEQRVPLRGRDFQRVAQHQRSDAGGRLGAVDGQVREAADDDGQRAHVVEVRVGQDHRGGWMLGEALELGQGSLADGAGAGAGVDEEVPFVQAVEVGAGSDLVRAAQTEKMQFTHRPILRCWRRWDAGFRRPCASNRPRRSPGRPTDRLSTETLAACGHQAGAAVARSAVSTGLRVPMTDAVACAIRRIGPSRRSLTSELSSPCRKEGTKWDSGSSVGSH